MRVAGGLMVVGTAAVGTVARQMVEAAVTVVVKEGAEMVVDWWW